MEAMKIFNNRFRAVVAFLIAGYLVSACNSYHSLPAISCDMSKPKPINQDQIQSAIDNALSGSSQDSINLYHYHFLLNDSEKAKYWAMIAAQNGNSIGQYNYGWLLVEYGNKEEKLRGKFWLDVAKRCGNNNQDPFVKIKN
jgi:hypothetical protein